MTASLNGGFLAPVVEVSELKHRYGSTTALRGVDLRIDAGEIHALLGANGSGKTTTIRILATLLAPTSGTVRVLGIDVVSRPDEVRRRIGVALQEVGLDPLATGAELLRLQGRLRGLGRVAAAGRADELLDLVGLAAVAAKLICTYSGGMRRRLDLASALVCSPGVLLLDEPTTGLDPLNRIDVWREIGRLRDAGTTILLTTQYLEEADRLAGHISILSEGRVAARGTPLELKAGIASDSVTVELRAADRDAALHALLDVASLSDLVAHPQGLVARASDGAALIPRISERLREAGIAALRVSVRAPTLTDVFAQAAGQSSGEPDASLDGASAPPATDGVHG